MSISLQKVPQVYPQYMFYEHIAGAIYLCSHIKDGSPGYRLMLADVYKIHAVFDAIAYTWIVQADSVQFVRELLAGQHLSIVERVL